MVNKVLCELLQSNNMTLQELADKAELPLETVRNLYYGKVSDPKSSTLKAIGKVFRVSINYLLDEPFLSVDEEELIDNYRKCGRHGKSVVQFTASYEAVAAEFERMNYNKHKIVCVIPKGDISEGIIYDMCETEKIETSVKDAYVAIKMPDNHFAPYYCKGDVVLFGNKFPKSGDFAAFYITDRVFFRKYVEEDGKYILRCLHMEHEDIVMKRLDQVEYLGTCIGVIRE